MKSHNTFQRLVLPGLIFQSAMVGGGYATGRELVEFFLVLGPVNSLVAMIVATLSISLVTSIAFEFARSFSLYDYKSFFEKLLGPGWFVFEIAYIALVLLVLSVLGAKFYRPFAAIAGRSKYMTHQWRIYVCKRDTG